MQLSFDFQFMIGGDEVFCCYTVPYTYSECLAHLEELKKVHSSSRKSIHKSYPYFCSLQVYPVPDRRQEYRRLRHPYPKNLKQQPELLAHETAIKEDRQGKE